jgi:nicotinamide mononucleotide transporter
MRLWLEIAANALNTVSIVLAGRNNLHTWWCGALGCVLFGWVFFDAKLYADVTLQVFFALTSLEGYRRWRSGPRRELPVARTSARSLVQLAALGALVVAAYGMLLHRFTDAYAPFVDSAILTFSVLGQLLLMQRRIETWACWLLVNSLAVPVYWLRGLQLTAVLYACYWVNGWLSLRHWQTELRAGVVREAALP